VIRECRRIKRHWTCGFSAVKLAVILEPRHFLRLQRLTKLVRQRAGSGVPSGVAAVPKDEPLVPYRPTPRNTPARLATSIAADYVVENWITSSRSSATLAASRKARTLGAIRGLGVTNCTGSESGS
jgi:hypothetical protein